MKKNKFIKPALAVATISSLSVLGATAITSMDNNVVETQETPTVMAIPE